MIIIWTLMVVAVSALAGSFVFLVFQHRSIEVRRESLRESFWTRRNRLPLLIEAVKNGNADRSILANLISIRNKLLNEALPIDEEISLEKEVSSIINVALREGEKKDIFNKDTSVISIFQEVLGLTESMNVSLNDYLYSIQNFDLIMKRPWFMIFGFAFKNASKPKSPSGRVSA